MSIAAMRSAFDQAAGLRLRVHHFDLRYNASDNKQVIYVSGWHADNSPFEIHSAPFDGNPVARARDFADEIIHQHWNEVERQKKLAEEIMRRDHDVLRALAQDEPLTGKPMAAPIAIKGLPGKLREHLAKVTARAQAIADNTEKSVNNLHARMDDAEKMNKEIDATAAEMHQIVGMDNGGPA